MRQPGETALTDASVEEATPEVARATVRDTLAFVVDVLVPLIARGVIARRPRVVDFGQRIDADRRAVRRMQRLRSRYGPGLLRLRLPGRRLAVVLGAQAAVRILDETPEPFATANLEKRKALGHFQPHGVLISDASERSVRRPYNEQALDQSQPLHGLATPIVAKVREEAAVLSEQIEQRGELDWPAFIDAWWRAVRRVLFGDAAREDHAVTDLLTDLRHDANWSYLKPRRDEVRHRFQRQLHGHLERAEPGSLAGRLSELSEEGDVRPAHQVPQWMFAFDPAGMAAIRGLALLAAHPEHADRARAEIAATDLTQPQVLPFLRATVLESLRLWPTTPAILRDSTSDTQWGATVLPAGTGLLILALFFHRDHERLSVADSFSPHLWDDEHAHTRWPLVPFSAGPGLCPGRNVVLLTTTTMIAALLEKHTLSLASPPRLTTTHGGLTATLSPYALRFTAGPSPH